MRYLLSAAVLATLAAGPATAQMALAPVNLAEATKGYTYYNKPGADLAAHDADLADCMLLARDAKSIDALIGNGGIVGNMLTGAAEKGISASGTENCMVVRGWRVVLLSDAEGAPLATGPLANAVQTIGGWVGAETPHGTIVRVWNNDAARASSKRYAVRPAYQADRQLSVRIRTSEAKPTVTPPPALATTPPTLDPKWPKKPLKPADLTTAAPADAAIIVIRTEGLSMKNGIGVGFIRMGEKPNDLPSFTDHGPDAMYAIVGLLAAKKEGNWFAYAVPAGRWRIASMGLMPAMDFCLGGPAFEAKPGEVVYAGSFNLGSEDLGPNLSLDPAKAYLAGTPYADKLRSAEYVNGAQGPCYQQVLYALEIKGAPFEPGYRWGAAASAPAAAPAAAQ